ncbi:Cobyrinic acid ac-diamide synthase [Candidatus Magnetomoraceae bacterium gMMP-1]
MAKTICIFNHKGGVGKATTAYHLGWMLTEKGKRVLLVDANSQCNLSRTVLGEDSFEKFYIEHPEHNIKNYLFPAFDAKPDIIEPAQKYQVRDNKNLLIIPGSFELSEYEVLLGISFTLSYPMTSLQNFPGSFRYLIDITAKEHSIDYVIINMNSNLSPINQALLVSSDFFIVPASPDHFSVLAIKSLSQILPKWENWAGKARHVFSDAVYPLPNNTPKFLGTVIQRFNIKKGSPVKANKTLIKSINKTVKSNFIGPLKKAGMLLDDDKYMSEDFCLAQVPSFLTLNTEYQTYGKPVFTLPDQQLEKLGHVGAVLNSVKQLREKFYNIFSEFAENVINMTSDK